MDHSGLRRLQANSWEIEKGDELAMAPKSAQMSPEVTK
jgi:hypothetical protein